MKKYSEKYANYYKILSKARIGFELECFFDISFYKALELLNKELKEIDFHGFKVYHSSFTVDESNFKLERDLSGGQNMAELITGPLDYHTAKYYLIKLLNFIDKHGYTNDNSSLHINISFDDKTNYNLKNLNIVRQILTIDEDYIYKKFPSREKNIYCKSIKNIIPYKNHSFSDVSKSNISNMLKIPDDKYFGVNYMNVKKNEEQRVEFRYIGGKDYHKQVSDIVELMDIFIINTYNNISKEFSTEDLYKLEDLVNMKVDKYKKIETYENFLTNYQSVELQINKSNQFDVLNSQYSRFVSDLYDLVTSIDDLGECVINYYTVTNKLEIIGAQFEAIDYINGVSLIDCEISNGIFNNCEIHRSKLINTEINKSTINDCEVVDSKLTSCNTESSELINCYFQSGYLNSDMYGGIFRSGKLGINASFGEDTVIVSKEQDSFFSKDDDRFKKANDEDGTSIKKKEVFGKKYKF